MSKLILGVAATIGLALAVVTLLWGPTPPYLGCKPVCTIGQASGDSCIEKSDTRHMGWGEACNSLDTYPSKVLEWWPRLVAGASLIDWVAVVIGITTIAALLVRSLQVPAEALFRLAVSPFVRIGRLLYEPLLLNTKHSILRPTLWIGYFALAFFMAWQLSSAWWMLAAGAAVAVCVAVFLGWSHNEDLRGQIASEWDQKGDKPDTPPERRPDNLPELRTDAITAVLLLFPLLAFVAYRLSPSLVTANDLGVGASFVIDQFIRVVSLDALDALEWQGFSGIQQNDLTAEGNWFVLIVRITFSVILIGTLVSILSIQRALDSAANQFLADPSAIAAYGSRGWRHLQSKHWVDLARAPATKPSGYPHRTPSPEVLEILKARLVDLNDAIATGAARAIRELYFSGAEQELVTLANQSTRSLTTRLEGLRALAVLGQKEAVAQGADTLAEGKLGPNLATASQAMRFLGHSLIDLGQPRNARDAFKRATELSQTVLNLGSRSVEDIDNHAASLEGWGQSRVRLGQGKYALDNFVQAVHFRKEARSRSSNFARYVALWNVMYDKAQLHLSRTNEMAEARNLLNELREDTSASSLAPWSQDEKDTARQWRDRAEETLASLNEVEPAELTIAA